MKQRPEQLAIPTPQQIFDHLERYVIGQKRAKRAVALAAYGHLRRAEAMRRGFNGVLRKSNILLIGPTGCGKTLLARHLAEVLSAPFATADATEFTEAGYYGKDVELMVTDLYLNANHSLDDAQRGVVFIDEIDKIARRTQGAQNGAGARDIGGEGVQQALLKLLEGREVQVPVSNGQPWNRPDTVSIDTTNILFVCAGTFSDLHEDRRAARRTMGFEATLPAHRRARRKRITQPELVSFGMLAEFLGRLPVLVELDELAEDELLRVLVEPEDAIVREYRARLALDGVDLALRPSALREIVKHAQERRVGARGLRALLEEVCADILFDAPTLQGRKIVVDAPYVRRRLRDAGDDLGADA